jgi:hypothetical protein
MERRVVTPYDQLRYQPPAPIALLTLKTLDGRELSISNVPALVDTGADVTLLPRWAVEQLGLNPEVEGSVTLAWFDGSVRAAETYTVAVSFQGGRFQGKYAVIDQPHGILGRNILNHFRLLFDGPAKTWQRVAAI